MSSDLGSVGAFGAVVWPTHAGMLNEAGVEPWWWSGYARSQIRWDVGEDGKLVGHTTTKIIVPKGTYTDIAFTHTPSGSLIIAAQRISHPFVFDAESEIQLVGITEADFTVAVKSWQH